MQWLTAAQFEALSPAMAIDHVVKLSWYIEKIWDDEEERRKAVAHLQCCLQSWQNQQNPALLRLSRFAAKLPPDMSLKHFLGVMVPIEREFSRGIRDDDFLIREGDAPAAPRSAPMPLTIVLDHIRSAFNVGGIFRTAECLGISDIHLCGYTASADDAKTKKTAMGCDALVNWRWHQHAAEVLRALKDNGVFIVAIETAPDAPSLYDFAFPRPCALIFGNERHGIGRELLPLADELVHIPVFGRKNSLNIATAVGICGYEIRRQWGMIPGRA